jgi:hypothetical protein
MTDPRDEEKAWLIESRFKNANGPLWWQGTLRAPSGWTNDSLEAVRFARKQDAEAAMYGLEGQDPRMMFVSEHIWGLR